MKALISISRYRWFLCLNPVRFQHLIETRTCSTTLNLVPTNIPCTGPDDILIRLNYTGLCSSDIHMMQGDLGLPPMSSFGVRSPGHEGAGVVVKVGANVTNFKLGDRAGIKPIIDTCGSCTLCWDDKETYCKRAIHAGLMTAGESNLSQ
jgi:D-arabinose 1-dehydrogenase-like Zn-dependent alcohol dehydrogenase